MKGCPATGELYGFLQGALASERASALEVHVDGCESCRQCLAAMVRGRARQSALGRYCLEGLLGAGGMGLVYRAYDPKLGRPLAIKVVKPAGDVEAHDDLRQRLEKEAQALARVKHPNVCQVFDVGENDGELWVAMELVEGVNMRSWLATRPPAGEVLAVLRQVAEGLGAAHAVGLCHRDVKPDNVLVEPGGRAVVTDFGLARPQTIEQATKTSLMAGTPAYMAPEQFEGHAADARSDQYAFAVMAHEALAGSRPRPRGTAAGTLPETQRQALVRGMADDPAARFPSIASLMAALTAPSVRSRRWWLPVAAGLAAAAAIAVVIARWPHAPAPQPVTAAPSGPAPLAAVTPSQPQPAPTEPAAAEPARPEPAPAPSKRAVPAAEPSKPEPATPAPPTTPPVSAPPPATTPAAPTGSVLMSGKGWTIPSNEVERAEQWMDFHCSIPVDAAHPDPLLKRLPVDWGKVTRREELDLVVTGSNRQDTPKGETEHVTLYEIAGQRKTYRFDATPVQRYDGRRSWVGPVIEAKVGDWVAVCPDSESHAPYQVPASWAGDFLHPGSDAIAVTGGPPRITSGDRKRFNPLWVEPKRLERIAYDGKWPFGERNILVFTRVEGNAHLTGSDPLVEMYGGFWLDGLSESQRKSLVTYGYLWVIAGNARFEPHGGKQILVLTARSMDSQLFPSP